jgi:hypothetical protein
MAQTCTVIQADPTSLVEALVALAATEEIQLVQKTSSAGKFLVISEAPSTGQQLAVVVGDPDKLKDDINFFISIYGVSIDLVIPTFSAAHYVVIGK